MVLHHVAQCAGAIVIAAAAFHADLFSDRDGHVIHIAPVPDGLEQRIGKAKCQHVLHRFLAEVMVDAVRLRFVEVAGERAIQGGSGIKIVADGFLDYDARTIPVGRQAGMAEKGGDFAE